VGGDDIDRGPRAALAGALALAALAGGCLSLAGCGVFSAAPASGRAPASSPATVAGCGAAATRPCAASPAGIAVAVPPAVVTAPPSPAGARPGPAGAGPSAPASSRAPSPRPAAPGTGTAGARPSAPATAPAGSPAAAAQVLALINQARSAAGLPALTITSGLEASSSAHNLRMAGGCGLSHQCPGEPALGARETAAGVAWTAAGENIGEGGPVAAATAAISQMAVGLTQAMLNEKPPDDGHRRNILSSTYTHVGIAVYRDSAGTVWLTQDFSN
jgi:uncharacterized protein YkwD